jgi:hypothetical protein
MGEKEREREAEKERNKNGSITADGRKATEK